MALTSSVLETTAHHLSTAITHTSGALTRPKYSLFRYSAASFGRMKIMGQEPHTRREAHSNPNQISSGLMYSPNCSLWGVLRRATMTMSAPRNSARRIIAGTRNTGGTVDAVVLSLCGSNCGDLAIIGSTVSLIWVPARIDVCPVVAKSSLRLVESRRVAVRHAGSRGHDGGYRPEPSHVWLRTEVGILV